MFSNNKRRRTPSMMVTVRYSTKRTSVMQVLSRHFQAVTTILAIIFWPFAMFKNKFDPPQLKQNFKSGIKSFVCKLPCESLNNFRLRIIGNLRIFGESPNWLGQALVDLDSPSRNDFLAIAIKNYRKADIKVFWSSPILFGFLLLVIYVFPVL